VPQKQAQRIYVHAILQAVGSEVVTEAVDAAAAGDAGPPFKVDDDHLDAACRQVMVVRGSPQHLTVLGPDVKVALKCFPGLAVDGYHPELGTLAHDPHLSQFGVEVSQLDVGQLRYPQSGIDQEGDDGNISDAKISVAKSSVVPAHLEEGLHLLLGVGLDFFVPGWAQFHP